MAVDKLVDSAQLESDLTSVADAIRAKTGGTTDLQFPTDFVSEIGSISGGGTVAVEEKDVTFYDYDGTPVASYTEQEAYALTALPPNPSHSGLTAQGWNWTLAEIKAQIDDAPGGDVCVGQNYVTDDGKTRLYINIPDGTPTLGMTFYVQFSSTAVGNVTIDWGDGTTEQNTATARTIYSHTYANTGDFVIKLSASSGTYTIAGSSSSAVFGNTANAWNRNRIKKVELGSSCKLGDYAFYMCYALETISIPTGIGDMGQRALQDCIALLGAILPSGNPGTLFFNNNPRMHFFSFAKDRQRLRTGNANFIRKATVTSAGFVASAFYGDAMLERLVFPTSGITAIPSQSFYNCTGLQKLTIPATVTSIGSEAFRACNGILEYHFLPASPPTLGNTNAFTGINASCVIYVPYSEDHSILGAYQTATNWSTYASYMQEETP